MLFKKVLSMIFRVRKASVTGGSLDSGPGQALGLPVPSPPPPRPHSHQRVSRLARVRTGEGTALAVAGRDKVCNWVGAWGQKK